MSHFKAKMHQIRFLTSVRVSVCVLDEVWHIGAFENRLSVFSAFSATKTRGFTYVFVERHAERSYSSNVVAFTIVDSMTLSPMHIHVSFF